jgi:hypothetical protein
MSNWRLSLHQGIALIEFDTGMMIAPDILKSIYHALNSEPDKYRTTNTVWDFRNIEVDPDLGFDEMMQIVKHIKSQWDHKWQSTKSAMVVKTKAVYGLVRIYAALVEDQLDYEVNLFDNDLQAAIDWAQPAS